jgi:Uma2 family endonuclease
MSDMLLTATEEPRTRPITVEEYHRMDEAGIFGPTERVQLVSGVIVQMPPPNPPHANTVTKLVPLLLARFGDRAVVRPQQPVVLDTRSEPEPDVALVRMADYSTAHPTAADVFLVIEVSDSTLRFDRGLKLAAYAAAGVREYWIVNVRERTVEIYMDPGDGGYLTSRVARAAETLACQAFPDDQIPVRDLLAGIARTAP